MIALLKFIIAVIISFGLFIGGFYTGVNSSFYIFGTRGQWEVKKLAEAMKQFQKQDLERKMADTYGGKTPQETLAMFISAVEKGDYELASKYFVEEKRNEWKEILQQLDKNKLNWFLFKMLKNTQNSYEGLNENFYTIESIADQKNNVKYSTIDFVKYQNNIWKISSIEPKQF